MTERASLDLILNSGTKPAELVATLTRVAALKDVVSERETAVRNELERSVRQLAEAAGGQFTVRADAGMAYLAGGNPRVQVVEPDAAGRWLSEHDLAVEVREVEVVDHEMAARIVQDLQESPPSDPVEAANGALELAGTLKVLSTWRIGDLDAAVDEGRFVVSDDRLVDPSTGETVPGVAVTYTRETLTVRPDKATRNVVADAIRSSLPALGAGDD